jgi:dsDNA-specific endonuclease/ATPase MutS2
LQNNLEPLLTSASVFSLFLAFGGFIIFLARNSIISWLNHKTSFEYKRRLARLEANLSKDRSELEDLRQLISSNALNRRQEIVKKQIEAIETVWSSLVDNKKKSGAARFLKSLNIEEIDKQISSTQGQSVELLDALVFCT